MKELLISKSSISKWVEPLHLPKNTDVRDFQSRIKETKRKIASISQKLEYLIQRKGLEHGDWMTHLHLIWRALGVYDISGVEREDTLGRVWFIRRNPADEGIGINNWIDYLGDQSIREHGGVVIVMLSHDGVAYLNDMNNTISSYSSSYTTP